MRIPKIPAVICIVAIILISLYSAYTINRVIISNKLPAVAFTLGVAYRDVIYSARKPWTFTSQMCGYASYSPCNLCPRRRDDFWRQDKYQSSLSKCSASAGYAVASMNYRLAPQYKFPAQIEDLKCAIRFLRANAQTYGLTEAKFSFRHQRRRRALRNRSLDRHKLAIRRRPLPKGIQ